MVWYDSVSHVKVFICTEKPTFSTDVPLAFIQIINYNKNKVYEFYGLGTNYEINSDSIIVFKNDANRHNGLEGWYFKDDNRDFVTSENKKLIFENNLLYEMKGSNYQEVAGKIYSLNSVIDSELKKVKVEAGCLYKYDKNKIRKVSSNCETLFSAKLGMYYIPPPGSLVECVFEFKILVSKFGD